MNNGVPAQLLHDNYCTIRRSFAELLKVKDDRLLEIEARLGTILDRKTGARIDLGAVHPVIMASEKSEFYFQSGVSQPFFESVCDILSDLDSGHTEEIVVIKNKIRTIYSEGNKTVMRKIRLRTFEMHLPGNQYDIRMSFSKEEVLGGGAGTRTAGKQDSGFRRERSRTSALTPFYRFDMTTIRLPNRPSYEVEIEIVNFEFDRTELFNILENITK